MKLPVAHLTLSQSTLLSATSAPTPGPLPIPGALEFDGGAPIAGWWINSSNASVPASAPLLEAPTSLSSPVPVPVPLPSISQWENVRLVHQLATGDDGTGQVVVDQNRGISEVKLPPASFGSWRGSDVATPPAQSSLPAPEAPDPVAALLHRFPAPPGHIVASRSGEPARESICDCGRWGPSMPTPEPGRQGGSVAQDIAKAARPHGDMLNQLPGWPRRAKQPWEAQLFWNDSIYSHGTHSPQLEAPMPLPSPLYA